MTWSDDALDRLLRDADPARGAVPGAPPDADRARITAGPPRPPGARLRAAVAVTATIAVVAGIVAALLVAVPDDRPADAPPPATTTAPVPAPQPPAPQVRTAPPAARSAAPIALLGRAGLPVAQVPEAILRGVFCDVYADRVHRIATTRTGAGVYVAWGPGDQVVWGVLAANGGGSGGCSSGAEIRDERGILLRPEADPELGAGGPAARRSVVGVALDGYTRASGGGAEAPVTGNVFALDAPRDVGTVTLRGPRGTIRLR